MKAFLTFCLLGLVLSYAQSPTPSPTPNAPAGPWQKYAGASTPQQGQYTAADLAPVPELVNCELFADLVSGCKSFNELVAAKDKEVLRAFGAFYQTYVCFRQNEDVFTIIHYMPWGVVTPLKDPKTGMLEATGVVFLARYKEGGLEDVRVFPGKWSAVNAQDEAQFSGHGLNDPSNKLARLDSASIDDSNLLLSYKFNNVSGKITTYSLAIRRSTKRSSETFDVPPATTAKDRNHMHFTVQNSCEYYERGARQ